MNADKPLLAYCCPAQSEPTRRLRELAPSTHPRYNVAHWRQRYHSASFATTQPTCCAASKRASSCGSPSTATPSRSLFPSIAPSSSCPSTSSSESSEARCFPKIALRKSYTSSMSPRAIHSREASPSRHLIRRLARTRRRRRPRGPTRGGRHLRRDALRSTPRRARRHRRATPRPLATLIFAERRFGALPIDRRVAPYYGRLLADARRRRGKKLQTAGVLIAATAAAHELPLLTRDRDFSNLESVDAIIV
jgi:PIN domain-containing protein